MSGFEIVGLFIIAFVMLCIAVGYRLLNRPSGIWRERGKYRHLYIEKIRTNDPGRYRWGYQEHQKAMIVWFEPPLCIEFDRKARALRDKLAENERNPKDALKLWPYLLDCGRATSEAKTQEAAEQWAESNWRHIERVEEREAQKAEAC